MNCFANSFVLRPSQAVTICWTLSSPGAASNRFVRSEAGVASRAGSYAPVRICAPQAPATRAPQPPYPVATGKQLPRTGHDSPFCFVPAIVPRRGPHRVQQSWHIRGRATHPPRPEARSHWAFQRPFFYFSALRCHDLVRTVKDGLECGASVGRGSFAERFRGLCRRRRLPNLRHFGSRWSSSFRSFRHHFRSAGTAAAPRLRVLVVTAWDSAGIPSYGGKGAP